MSSGIELATPLPPLFFHGNKMLLAYLWVWGHHVTTALPAPIAVPIPLDSIGLAH